MVKIKKTRKAKQSSNKPDMHYAARQRTNVCGTTKRTRDGINLEGLFVDNPALGSVKRSKSMLMTVAKAEEYLRYKYGKDDGEDEDDGKMQLDSK